MSRLGSLTPEEDLLDLAMAVREAEASVATSEKYKARLSADLKNIKKALANLEDQFEEADQELVEAARKALAAKAAWKAAVKAFDNGEARS